MEASSPEPRSVTPLQISDGEGDGPAEPLLLLDVATTETKRRSASWSDLTRKALEEDPAEAGVWRGVVEQLQKLVLILMLHSIWFMLVSGCTIAR